MTTGSHFNPPLVSNSPSPYMADSEKKELDFGCGASEENGKLLTTKAKTWPRMYNAGPGKPNDDIAGASRRISLLDRNQQHEVQVAACTGQSCDATGAWSSSRYIYSR